MIEETLTTAHLHQSQTLTLYQNICLLLKNQKKRRKQSLREFVVVIYFEIPRVAVLWMKSVIKGGFAGNRRKSPGVTA